MAAAGAPVVLEASAVDRALRAVQDGPRHVHWDFPCARMCIAGADMEMFSLVEAFVSASH